MEIKWKFTFFYVDITLVLPLKYFYMSLRKNDSNSMFEAVRRLGEAFVVFGQEIINGVNDSVGTSSSSVSNNPRPKPVIVDGKPYQQKEGIQKILEKLSTSNTGKELMHIFSAKAIFGTDLPNQQVLLSPELHENVSSGYKKRYNIKEPIKTKDGQIYYAWTNWGIYKTLKGEQIEGTTPKFVRIAQRQGVDVRLNLES